MSVYQQAQEEKVRKELGAFISALADAIEVSAQEDRERADKTKAAESAEVAAAAAAVAALASESRCWCGEIHYPEAESRAGSLAQGQAVGGTTAEVVGAATSDQDQQSTNAQNEDDSKGDDNSISLGELVKHALQFDFDPDETSVGLKVGGRIVALVDYQLVITANGQTAVLLRGDGA